MSDKILYEMSKNIGYIKGKVEAIEKGQTEQNGSIAELRKTTHRHDIILGKIGIIFTGVLVLGDIAVKSIFAFFKK